MTQIQTILVVGGSDSSGGAGIQADSAVARCYGIMPVCGVSCVTSQGLNGLRMMQPVTPAIFESQLEISFGELNPAGVKIGMLPNSELAEILISFLERNQPDHVVLDPVMGASKGLSLKGINVWSDPCLLQKIAPYIQLFTPNLPEAMQLMKMSEDSRCTKNYSDIQENADFNTSSIDKLHELAKSLSIGYGFGNILLKAGHVNNEILPDCLYSSDSSGFHLFPHKRIDTLNTHGTGCALSTAILCEMILNPEADIFTACSRGIDFLQKSLINNRYHRFFGHDDCYGPAFFELKKFYSNDNNSK